MIEIQLDVELDNGTQYTLVLPVSDWLFDLIYNMREIHVKRAELQFRNRVPLVNLKEE